MSLTDTHRLSLSCILSSQSIMILPSTAPSTVADIAGETEQTMVALSTDAGLNGIPSPPSASEDSNDSNQQNFSAVVTSRAGNIRSAAGVVDGVPSHSSSAVSGHDKHQLGSFQETHVTIAATKLKKNRGKLEIDAVTVQLSDVKNESMEYGGQPTLINCTNVHLASSGAQEESTTMRTDGELLEGYGIATEGGRANALPQPGPGEQPENFPQPAGAQPPAADPPPALQFHFLGPPQFDLDYMGELSQAQYICIMESFPKLENA